MSATRGPDAGEEAPAEPGPSARAAPRRGAPTPLGALGAVCCALLLGYALLLHHGLGARPLQAPEGPWTPTGFLLDGLRAGPFAEIAGSLPLAFATLGALALLLAAAVFLATPSALARWLAASALVATALVLYYAIESPRVWGFFHWRWSACIALFALVVGAAATAPLLVARGRRLPLAARAALALAVLALVLVLKRDVTGTAPELPFALSPWPVVPVFGLDVLALALACAFLGAGAGGAGLSRAAGRGGAAAWLGGALGLALAGGGTALVLWAARGVLPFAPGAPTYVAGAAAGVLAFGLALAPAPRQASAWRRRSAHLLWSAALVGLPIALGQAWVQLDYAETREERAARIIRALERYRERERAYPERLAGLVEAGALERVPEPAVGFGLLSRPAFTYQNFGESYLLEFSAPRWVQCAYNPPYPESFDAEPDAAAGASEPPPSEDEPSGGRAGSWSCPSEPPELW